MKVLYGYDNAHYLDITADVFKKCFKDDGIHIPMEIDVILLDTIHIPIS